MSTDTDHILVKAIDLLPEDKVDLELDPYADDDPDGPSITYQYEYAIVYQVDPSDVPPWAKAGADAVSIEFEDGDYILFPKDHMLRVAVDSPGRV